MSEIIGFPYGHNQPPVEPPRTFTATDLSARLQELSDQNVQLAIKKNGDYATADDPFANFRASELVGVPIERAMLVRMTDKLKRAGNLVDRPPEVKDESITDTLRDLSLYALILCVWLEQR